VCFLHKNKVTG